MGNRQEVTASLKTMKRKLQIQIITLCFLGTIACMTEPKKNSEDVNLLPKNDFPIAFVSRQLLDLDSAYIPPRGGQSVKADSFSVYSIYNRTQDTVWLHTMKHTYEEASIKDRRIRNIDFGSSTSFHNKKTGLHGISIGDDFCPDSVILIPNQAIFFTGNDYEKQIYDTIRRQISITKHGKKTSIPKTLVLSSNGEYFELTH